MKLYLLTAPDRSIYKSDTPGTLGGNAKLGIYGRLDCWSAVRALPKRLRQAPGLLRRRGSSYRSRLPALRSLYAGSLQSLKGGRHTRDF